MDNATKVFRDIYNKEKVTELFRAREMTEEEIKYVIIDESPNFTKEMFDELVERMNISSKWQLQTSNCPKRN